MCLQCGRSDLTRSSKYLPGCRDPFELPMPIDPFYTRTNLIKIETNCRNCGAPANDAKCSYCGTIFSVIHLHKLPSGDISEAVDYNTHMMSTQGVFIKDHRRDLPNPFL